MTICIEKLCTFAEIVCANEYDMYLKTIIHELGMKLRSNATCMQLHCVQDGLFNVQHALLQKHWTVQDIVNSMQTCQYVLDRNKYVLHQENPALVEPSEDTAKAPTIDHLSAM